MGNALAEMPMRALSDATGLYTSGSETVTLNATGLVSNAIRVLMSTTTSNEIGFRKELSGINARILQFRFKIEANATFNPSSVHNLVQLWSSTAAAPSNVYGQEALQIRLATNGSSTTQFFFQLYDPATSNAVTGTTVCNRDTWYKIIVVVTDTSFQLYIDDEPSGRTAAELNWTGKSNANKYFSAASFGKFYSYCLAGAINFGHIAWYAAPGTAPTTTANKNLDCYYGWKQRFRIPASTGKGAAICTFNPNAGVVSEGQGYALLLSVEYSDQTFFDEIETFCWTTMLRQVTNPGQIGANMMSWSFNPITRSPFDVGWATDGDVDRLDALWRAHAKWGSAGAINYRARAIALAADFKAYVFKTVGRYRYLTTDQYATNNNPGENNMSYHNVTALRRCRQELSDQFWDQAIDGSYDTLADVTTNSGALATSKGLPPNWHFVDSSGNVSIDTNRDSNYTYDAIRTPWRFFKDWYFERETRAYQWLTGNFLTFLQAEYSANGSKIYAEYTHAGAVKDNNPYESVLMYAMNMFAFFAQSPTNTTGQAIYTNKVLSSYAQHPAGSYWGSPAYYGNALICQAILLKESLEANKGFWTRTHSQGFMN